MFWVTVLLIVIATGNRVWRPANWKFCWILVLSELADNSRQNMCTLVPYSLNNCRILSISTYVLYLLHFTFIVHCSCRDGTNLWVSVARACRWTWKSTTYYMLLCHLGDWIRTDSLNAGFHITCYLNRIAFLLFADNLVILNVTSSSLRDI